MFSVVSKGEKKVVHTHTHFLAGDMKYIVMRFFAHRSVRIEWSMIIIKEQVGLFYIHIDFRDESIVRSSRHLENII